MGKIADILEGRGEVEEAKKLHEENLTTAAALGDVEMRAHALWCLAQIALRRSDLQAAFERLAESYAILTKLGRLDGICAVGRSLGQVLIARGAEAEGRMILERSRDGYQRLGQEGAARHVEELLAQLPAK